MGGLRSEMKGLFELGGLRSEITGWDDWPCLIQLALRRAFIGLGGRAIIGQPFNRSNT